MQVVLELGAVLGKLDDALGEGVDVEQVDLGDVHAHAVLGGVEHLLRLSSVHADGLHLVQVGGGEGLALADEPDESRVHVVVADDLDELGEVPRVPLAHAHREGVDVLVERVEDGDALDDVLVRAVDVELDLGARVGVGETQLCLLEVAGLEDGEELRRVCPRAAQQLGSQVVAHARDVELLLDGLAQAVLRDSHGHLGLLARLASRHVRLQERLESGRDNPL
mmetsp:Transcript_32643/g.77164  ORF Transcript_32643/g.77164 Transcript_32643/m.77164 type:complete len:223 (-) Transcript_32643:231-899(-)